MSDQNQMLLDAENSIPEERPDGEIKFLDLDSYVPRFITIKLNGKSYKLMEGTTKTMMKVQKMEEDWGQKKKALMEKGETISIGLLLDSFKDQIEFIIKQQHPEFSKKELDSLYYQQVFDLFNEVKGTLTFFGETPGTRSRKES